MNAHLYRVNTIYGCLQGEGAMTGVPMVMLRLQGCAVGCPWCDTIQTWHTLPEYKEGSIEEALGTNPKYAEITQHVIAAYIRARYENYKWILISGGEPSEQYLQPLVFDLGAVGFKVALETSGTAIGHLKAGFDWVTVSPKFDMPGGKTVRDDCLKEADEIKMVIGKQADIDLLTAIMGANDLDDDKISLQPVSQSTKATQLCIKTVQERGWRLSVQVHKYLEIP